MAGQGQDQSETQIVIGSGASVVGSVRIEGDLIVEGTLEGDIHASGDVLIQATGKAQAAIEARNLTIRGSAAGEFTCSRLRMTSASTFQGYGQTGKLVVAEGASIEGTIRAGEATANTDSPDRTGTWFRPGLARPAS